MTLRRGGTPSEVGDLRITLTCALVVATVWFLGEPAAAQQVDAYAEVTAGAEAFAAGRYDEALQAYEAAAEVLGDTPELEYNRAAAEYKLGRYDQAAERFARAALTPDRELSGRARFGWGNCQYARVLAELEAAQAAHMASGGQGQPAPQPDLPGAIKRLNSAISHYRDSLGSAAATEAGDATHRAARENIERAQRLSNLIEQMLEQQQQQQPQQGDESQQEQNDQQDQQQQGRQQEDEQQPQQQDEKQGQQENEQPRNQQEQEQQEGQQQDREEQQPQAGEPQERQMTEEELEAVLQAVRDREKKRREETARRVRARQEPVARDW